MKSIEFNIINFVIFYLVPIQSLIDYSQIEAILVSDEDYKISKAIESIFFNTGAVEENGQSDIEFFKGELIENRRSIKGSNATFKAFPFMASVHIANKSQCGGSIIKADLVITAASCLQIAWNNHFFRNNPEMIYVRVGSDHSNTGGEKMDVLEINFHPLYDSKTLANNLAIIRLVKKIKFDISNRVEKIGIDKIPYALGQNVSVITALGWGATTINNNPSSGSSNNLYYDKLNIYSWQACQGIYTSKYVTQTNFCAGFTSKEGGTCYHDVGGPGISEGVLMGVISFGSSTCGHPDSPTVFTKLGFYTDWIEKIMAQPPRTTMVPRPETVTSQKAITVSPFGESVTTPKKFDIPAEAFTTMTPFINSNISTDKTFTVTFIESITSSHSNKSCADSKKPGYLRQLSINFMESLVSSNEPDDNGEKNKMENASVSLHQNANEHEAFKNKQDDCTTCTENKSLPITQNTQYAIDKVKKALDILLNESNQIQQPAKPMFDVNTEHKSHPRSLNTQYAIDKVRNAIMDIASQKSDQMEQAKRNSLIDFNSDNKSLPKSQNNQYALDKIIKAIIDISSRKSNQIQKNQRKPMTVVDNENQLLAKFQNTQSAIDSVQQAIIDIASHKSNQMEHGIGKTKLISPDTQYAIDEVKKAIDILSHNFNKMKQEKVSPVINVNTEHISQALFQNIPYSSNENQKAINDLASRKSNRIDTGIKLPISQNTPIAIDKVKEAVINILSHQSTNFDTTTKTNGALYDYTDLMKYISGGNVIGDINSRATDLSRVSSLSPSFPSREFHVNRATNSDGIIGANNEVPIGLSLSYGDITPLRQQESGLEYSEHMSRLISQNTQAAIDEIKKAIEILSHKQDNIETTTMTNSPLYGHPDLIKYYSGNNVIRNVNPRTVDLIRKSSPSIGVSTSEPDAKRSKDIVSQHPNLLINSDVIKGVSNEVSFEFRYSDEKGSLRKQERGLKNNEDDSLPLPEATQYAIDKVKMAMVDLLSKKSDQEKRKWLIDVDNIIYNEIKRLGVPIKTDN